ncbi:DUF308 domain-containing protein [Mesobacillus foraminis]|uniref:hypothetical protein n=1 Tax=Mesobacillus foraminis TaxID=279826 RepID=UPI0039A02F79
MMADQSNQDKPEYINEPQQDVLRSNSSQQGGQNNTASSITPGASVPMPSMTDFDQSSMTNQMGSSATNTQNREETAAEIAAPVPAKALKRNQNNQPGQNAQDQGAQKASGSMMGISAIAISILSLFVLPFILGATGIVLGFIARSRGAKGLGSWAIGIGALSVIIGMFILPFF